MALQATVGRSSSFTGTIFTSTTRSRALSTVLAVRVHKTQQEREKRADVGQNPTVWARMLWPVRLDWDNGLTTGTLFIEGKPSKASPAQSRAVMRMNDRISTQLHYDDTFRQSGMLPGTVQSHLQT